MMTYHGPVLFRAMTPQTNGRPMLARSPRALGVRVGPDGDVAPDAAGKVHPGGGGMSVSPCSPWNIPVFRRPIGMGRGSSGKPGDRMYALSLESLRKRRELAAIVDAARPFEHAFVEPACATPLNDYERDLAATQGDWKQVWP